MRLDGRKAIVTGAASGIGAAIANVFAARGARVLGVDLEAQTVAARHAGTDGIVTMARDVAAAGAAADIVGRAIEEFGALDTLVNAAGICPVGPLEEFGDSEWARVLDVNLNAVFRLTRAAIPALKASGRGRIINIGSVMSDFGGAGLGAYAVTKHGIAGLTKTLATELGRAGVTANYIKPGAIVTGMTRDTFEQNAAFREYWSNRAALGRWGRPEEVAYVAAFLACDEAAFVSGHGIAVDGGATQSV